LARAIKDEVRAALVHRRPIARCTWAYVRETASRQAIHSLKASGSKEIDDYVKTFDQEIEAMNHRLEDAEREIQRLYNELRAHEARAGTASGGLIKLGQERDFYPNEVLGILLDAIEDATTRVPPDSRRQHVLRSILEANRLEENPLVSRREQLKRLLRGTSTIDGKVRRELENMGFVISEGGRHFKLVFQGDDRYTFTFPKSGSDRRGGLNAASDIGKLLF
jgi:septal ring factor EnvC (AmiA/AmiB activator)